jgi:hypothetical protein
MTIGTYSTWYPSSLLSYICAGEVTADPGSLRSRRQTAKSLLKVINKEFGTLPFCRRYLDRLGQSGYLLGVSLGRRLLPPTNLWEELSLIALDVPCSPTLS